MVPKFRNHMIKLGFLRAAPVGLTSRARIAPPAVRPRSAQAGAPGGRAGHDLRVATVRQVAHRWALRAAAAAFALAAIAGAELGAAQADPAPPTPLERIIKHRPADDGGDRFLPVEEAFRLAATRLPTGSAELRFTVAPGYYLYRDRLKITAGSPQTRLGPVELPAGVTHEDSYFGPQQIYPGPFVVTVPVTGTPATLKVVYQGCAEAGLCYPPQTQVLQLSAQGAVGGVAGPAAPAAPGAAGGDSLGQLSALLRSGNLDALLASGNLLAIVLGFYLSGLLLSLTPCVLPMVPILSGIIVGEGARITTARSFLLSLAYVLGMAVTYTVAGAASAIVGHQAQALFQQPWILVAFAGLFVLLALSMFGAYELQLPSSLQSRFTELGNRLSGGKLLSVAVMGALSALVVTACVAPALVAALAVIARTGRIAVGATALFALAIGMGSPLLVVGATGGKLMPRAGPWMVTIKSLFGVGFLAVAAWLLERVVPARIAFVLYALVAATLVWVLGYVGLRARRPRWRVAAGALSAGYACALLVGALTGATDPLHPLARAPWLGARAEASALEFRPIKSTADLDRELASAARSGQRVMVDFYADWCASCKEMERATFADASVRAALGSYRLLQANVTATDADDLSLMKRFEVIGPPTTAFFATDGRERRAFRLAGFVDPAAFRTHLRSFEQAP